LKFLEKRDDADAIPKKFGHRARRQEWQRKRLAEANTARTYMDVESWCDQASSKDEASESE
jgi:hypothetical protein